VKKIINFPENALAEALEGFTASHAHMVRYDAAARVVLRKERKQGGKVALVSGGGSGHEPMHIGYVGRGMLDAACTGQIFTSPTPDQILAAADAVEVGGGVIFIVKNYAGDIMNFEMAVEMHHGRAMTVIIDDDVALRNSMRTSGQGNRGVAGTLIVEKIAGAAAERGYSIDRCVEVARQTNAATGSMAVALSSCVVPAAGTPNFVLGDDEMELGVGIHGEAGRERIKTRRADDLAELFVGSILERIEPAKDDPLLLMCNGLGGSPPIELYILYNSARKILTSRGYRVERNLIGTFCSALEMAGASITLTKLDTALLSLWDDPVETPVFRWA
jgi:dihydroxyacetone kinase-like protein